MHIGTGLRLKNYTLGGSFLAYAANGITPELVADFEGEFYGYDSTASTFDDMMTVSTTGLETMTDSDGLVKWNAHNLLTYSTDMSNAGWTVSGATKSGTSTLTLTEDTSTGTHFIESTDASFTSGVLYTFEVEAKPNGRDWIRINGANAPFPILRNAYFDIGNGVVGSKEANVVSSSIEATTDGFYLCTHSVIADATATGWVNILLGEGDGDTSIVGDGSSGVILRNPRIYRSDLGGMVNNPDRTDTYVPTTSAAVYKERRNACLYDASVAKWNAHNYCPSSATGADFSASSGTKATGVADPDGGTSAFSLTATSDNTDCKLQLAAEVDDVSVQHTFNVKAKYLGGSGWCQAGYLNANSVVHADLANGVIGTVGANVLNETITSLGDGWYELQFDLSAVGSAAIVLEPTDADGTTIADTGDSIAFYRPHAYRSDLNGVVANGDDGTYVATTATAVPATLNTVSFPNKGLRWESAAATNLLTDSNDFEAASWTKSDTTISADAVASPDGTTNADKLVETATTAAHVLFDGFSATSGTTYTFSVYLKAAERGFALIALFTAFPTTLASIDLSTGAVTVGAGVFTSTSEDVGDGWFRVSITKAATATTTGNAYIYTSTDGVYANRSYAGDITKGIYVYGSQVEAGSVPSSYLPTSGATATRAAETISIAGAKTPANTSAMSTYVKMLMTYADEGTAAQMRLFRWRTDASNNISHEIDTNAADTGEVNIDQIGGGTSTIKNATGQYSPGINVQYSVASRHLPLVINVAKDGTAETESVRTGTIPDLSATEALLGHTLNGFLQEVIIWGADIGDTGIAEAST